MCFAWPAPEKKLLWMFCVENIWVKINMSVSKCIVYARRLCNRYLNEIFNMEIKRQTMAKKVEIKWEWTQKTVLLSSRHSESIC